MVCAFCVPAKKSLPMPRLPRYSTFSSNSFWVWGFIFRRIIHQELIFICNVSYHPSNPFFFPFFFFGPHLQHMEVPRLGVQSELQLLACAADTATPDLSHILDLHWMPDPYSLSEARDGTHLLVDTSPVLNLLSLNGNAYKHFLRAFVFILFF